jgi:hypothetical protein
MITNSHSISRVLFFNNTERIARKVPKTKESIFLKMKIHVRAISWKNDSIYISLHLAKKASVPHKTNAPISFFLCTSYVAFIISKCRAETEISIRSDYVVRVNCPCILTRVRSRAFSAPIPQPHMRICISSVINTTLHVHCVFMLKGSSASWM